MADHVNPSKLLRYGLHESSNPLDVSLQESYKLCETKLIPPFSLAIPSPTEYTHLNLAIAYGFLTEPDRARAHITYLHAIVIDGYRFFTSTILSLSTNSYHKLLYTPRTQLLSVTNILVYVNAYEIDALLVSLLRQIIPGNVVDTNLWLCSKLLEILNSNWDTLLDEHPMVITSALFVFLRLLSDHSRFHSSALLDALKVMEIEFCIRVLRECSSLCLQIGRDLIRLLQDLLHIPQFVEIWKGLEDKFSHLYGVRTSSRYFLLRINPDMETKLRFLLTHVKFGSQKTYQAWFAKKYLSWPGSETAVPDIVRFICCAHHPPDAIIQSDVITRWAVIGWFLKSCTPKDMMANVNLALFYDWLFFNEKVDNIMNIEPAMLLMVHSLPDYPEITNALLEILFMFIEIYDCKRKEEIAQGVSSAFTALVRKGVVPSLEPLTLSEMLAPVLRERLVSFTSNLNLVARVNDTTDSVIARERSVQADTNNATAGSSCEGSKQGHDEEVIINPGLRRSSRKPFKPTKAQDYVWGSKEEK